MTTRIPESRHSHKKPPPRRAAAGNMLLTLLLVATWAGSTAGTTVVESAHTDESIERAPILSNNSNLRRAKGGDPSAFSKVTHDLLESILVRVKALEDENERLRGAVSSSLSSIPSPRNLQAATAPRALATTTPVTLMQLNQFKRSVTTQLATLNQSLQSTRALVDAFKVEVNDQLGQVRADLRAAQDSLVGIGNKTEKTEERTNDLEEALKGVAGRINTLERTTNNFTGRFGTLETTIDNFTSRMDQLTTQVEDGSDTLSGAVSRLDATSQEVSDLVGRLACIDASSSATDVVFSGCNVHVRNGAGQTTTTNGFGNIIVGYNERIGSHDRTGSHMVVVGPLNSWKGHAGIVVGSGHRQESGFASIIGGTFKTVCVSTLFRSSTS